MLAGQQTSSPQRPTDCKAEGAYKPNWREVLRKVTIQPVESPDLGLLPNPLRNAKPSEDFIRSKGRKNVNTNKLPGSLPSVFNARWRALAGSAPHRRQQQHGVPTTPSEEHARGAIHNAIDLADAQDSIVRQLQQHSEFRLGNGAANAAAETASGRHGGGQVSAANWQRAVKVLVTDAHPRSTRRAHMTMQLARTLAHVQLPGSDDVDRLRRTGAAVVLLLCVARQQPELPKLKFLSHLSKSIQVHAGLQEAVCCNSRRIKHLRPLFAACMQQHQGAQTTAYMAHCAAAQVRFRYYHERFWAAMSSVSIAKLEARDAVSVLQCYTALAYKQTEATRDGALVQRLARKCAAGAHNLRPEQVCVMIRTAATVIRTAATVVPSASEQYLRLGISQALPHVTSSGIAPVLDTLSQRPAVCKGRVLRRAVAAAARALPCVDVQDFQLVVQALCTIVCIRAQLGYRVAGAAEAFAAIADRFFDVDVNSAIVLLRAAPHQPYETRHKMHKATRAAVAACSIAELPHLLEAATVDGQLLDAKLRQMLSKALAQRQDIALREDELAQVLDAPQALLAGTLSLKQLPEHLQHSKAESARIDELADAQKAVDSEEEYAESADEAWAQGHVSAPVGRELAAVCSL